MSVMHVATLDILTEKGGFNPQAARAIGEAIDLEIARSRDASATKEDVNECRRSLSEEVAILRSATKEDINECRRSLSEEVAILRSATKEDINECQRSLSEEIATLRSATKEDVNECRRELGEEVATLRSATKEDINECRRELGEEIGTLREGVGSLRVDAQTIKSDLVRWVFVVIMGQTAMLLGVLYFFVKYVK